MEEELLKEFISISKKGWIKGINTNQGSVGLTFEQELGKKRDSYYLPDYNGIEIKCCTRYSSYPLYLFSIAFDGPTDNKTDRICQKYGYRDNDFPKLNVIFAKTNGKNLIMQRNGYKTKLNINEENKKLYLKYIILMTN